MIKFKNFKSFVGVNKVWLIIIGLLAIVLAFEWGCGNKVKSDDCVEFNEEYCESRVAAMADSLQAHYARVLSDTMKGNSGEVKVIVEERVVFKEHTTFVKNYNELQDVKVALEKKIKEGDEMLEFINNLSPEDVDSLIRVNGWVEVIEEKEVVELAVVKTDTSVSKGNADVSVSVLSRGELVDDVDIDIEVRPLPPVVVEKTRKPSDKEIDEAAQKLKKNNFIAIKGGVVVVDDFNNMYYTPSLQYGHKWWSVEGGFLLDEDFKFDVKDFQAQLGVVIKF